ncbi:ATP-binding cassette domain-containing protein [Herbaspirillum lusitanum]|uniref:ATP-binding cassette domain-containing protein n=1 Tax=Herbaspirillum lusitanum TaxID=213312 RepID=A0ABW9AEB3_9BURK
MSTPLVETQGLGVSFGGVHAVNSVDFRLETGELRCLIGPNGAGKSSFFRLLCGQYKPTRGSVKIKGQAIDGLQSYQIARLGLGIKTQVPSVFDGLSVEENIWLSARRALPARAAKTAATEAMDTVRLSAIAGKQVGTLSHGQRQWVELGIVMAARPDLILLDEPAAGMSDEEVVRTAELIREANRHCALIVVEHDMEFIRMIAKTVTVFNRGTVLVEDTVDKVLNDERVKDVYLGKDLEMRD